MSTGAVNRSLTISICVLMPVTIEIEAARDVDGEVRVIAARKYGALPSVREIEESMNSDNLYDMDEAFEEAERAADPAGGAK